MDPVTSLPHEVGIQIFSYLDPADLHMASHVSTYWNNFCLDRSLPKLDGRIRKICVENWWFEWLIIWKVIKFISKINLHQRGIITFQHPESKQCHILVEYGYRYEYWDRSPDIEETHELQVPLPYKDGISYLGYHFGVSLPTSREKGKGEFCNQIRNVNVRLPCSVVSRHRNITSKLEFIVESKYTIQFIRYWTSQLLKIVTIVNVILANLAILYRSSFD